MILVLLLDLGSDVCGFAGLWESDVGGVAGFLEVILVALLDLGSDVGGFARVVE